MSKTTRIAVLVVAAVALLLGGAVLYVERTLARRPASVPVELVPPSWERVRTSPGHERHLAHSNIACKDCHDYDANGFTKPAVSVCQRCHGQETEHVHAGGEKKTDCLSCHSFDPARQTAKCIDCHAAPAAAFPAVVAHRSVDCAQCHRLHEAPEAGADFGLALAVDSRSCASCHEERADLHADHPGSQNCLDCHRAHAPGAAARETCSSCHAKPSGPKPAGHDSCLGCHRPHEFAAHGASACVRCHGEKATLASASAPVHATCTSCHSPHAPGAAASSCATCHVAVHVEHDKKGECIACHQPHGEGAAHTAVLCTSCHAAVAGSEQGAHGGGATCTSCHRPHGFTPPRETLAVTFDSLSGRPHWGGRGAFCAMCHTSEATHAAENRGHTDCAQCHGASAHQPSHAPECGICHKSEASTAPAGHRACLQCHEPHGGQLVLAAIACGNCHAAEEKAQHGGIAGGCERCHRPHGPNGPAAPPACATCHEAQTLPALHGVAKHGTCNNCHSSHGPPRADRATCTGSCHEDRRAHQPQAAVCTGCHVFRL